MKPERWQQIESLLQSALERAPEQRADFLKEACAGDDELRREVESLLVYEEPAENFIDAPALQVAAKAMADDGAERVPMRLVGRVLDEKYRIEKQLGQGGMGAVF